MSQSVIIAIDHTPLAECAVKFYLEKVHRPGNRVVLVHCIELHELSVNKTKDSQASPTGLTTMWQPDEAKTKALETKMKDLLAAKQIPSVLRTVAGRPGETICAVAEQEQASLVITGSRNLGKVQRTFLGSVSNYIVGHAPCPVIVVRDPAEIDRKRRPSGADATKSRQPSGDSFAAHLRQRFASGGKKGSQQSANPPTSSDMGGEKKREGEKKGSASGMAGKRAMSMAT